MRKLPQSFAEPSKSSSADKKASLAHESALKYVVGKAQYLDDIPEWPNMLHVATGMSVHAHAKITSIDLADVVAADDVIDVIVQTDIPGDADISPVFTGDVLLAGDTVHYVGQPIFAVAARTFEAAKRAVKLAKIEYQVLPPLLHPRESVEQSDFVMPTHKMSMGDAEQAIKQAAHKISADMYIRGQEHFYLEGQISIALPNEDGGMHVLSSSQHPSEVQKLVASVLAVPLNKVQTEVRRMGGGFGGKESQAAALSCMAAVFAKRNQCPVKYRMPRQDDMVQTGKRHDFWNQYNVGFDNEGKLAGVSLELAGMCGCTTDLSDGIVDRAMFHADNAYYLNNADVIGYRCRTNTVSNTAFRGFGGPKGMLTTEAMLDDIARKLGKDPLDIRKINLYQGDNTETHYGQKVEEDVLPHLIAQLEESSNYRERREQITAFNKSSKWLKKGLALTPVKFGISFTSKHLNQAGALIHVYTDGSIHLNHGGTEMGQGLYTKVAQVVARGFGVDYQRIMISAARTDKVPNTSPTAASAGTDLNGMAALDAVNKIKHNLIEFAAEHYQVKPEQVSIRDDKVWIDDKPIAFEEFIKLAYMNRISLSSTGFYRTPKIGYDRASAKGRPFFYFANGASVSEVIVDVLTGEYKVTRVDILHDVGDSINPALDIGQIEGGFVQGMGWLTTEELLWDEKGKIISNSPANYKIPTATDVPEHFNVELFNRPNQEDNVYYSKAVGEPPLMLPISVWCALRDACASVCDYTFSPPLAAPATAEKVYECMQAAIAHARSDAGNQTSKSI